MDRLTSDRFNIHGVDINNARLRGCCWLLGDRSADDGYWLWLWGISNFHGSCRFVAVGLLRGVLNLKTILEICI